jgi:hypothetical protein
VKQLSNRPDWNVIWVFDDLPRALSLGSTLFAGVVDGRLRMFDPLRWTAGRAVPR